MGGVKLKVFRKCGVRIAGFTWGTVTPGDGANLSFRPAGQLAGKVFCCRSRAFHFIIDSINNAFQVLLFGPEEMLF